MAGMLQKSPMAGFIISALFGTFGLLLLQLDGTADAAGRIVLWMYRTIGGFLIFVAFFVLIAAAGTLARIKRARTPRQ